MSDLREQLKASLDINSPDFKPTVFAAQKPKFDPLKPCRTKGGRPAIIVAIGINSEFPIAAVLHFDELAREDEVAMYTADGKFRHSRLQDSLDLVNIEGGQ